MQINKSLYQPDKILFVSIFSRWSTIHLHKMQIVDGGSVIDRLLSKCMSDMYLFKFQMYKLIDCFVLSVYQITSFYSPSVYCFAPCMCSCIHFLRSRCDSFLSYSCPPGVHSAAIQCTRKSWSPDCQSSTGLQQPLTCHQPSC